MQTPAPMAKAKSRRLENAMELTIIQAQHFIIPANGTGASIGYFI